MIPRSSLAPLLLALSWASTANGMYGRDSPVLQVTGKTFESLIGLSNHTSIVEFYAPWCGHCQNLKPAYEKAAQNLNGLAKVAAVDCDYETNKPLCGRMGVSGFPTLKIFRPGPKPGHPVIDNYEGPRTAKAIADAVREAIPNHVKRLKGDALEKWLAESSIPAKAVVFSDKSAVSPLVKSLAVDFLGSIAFAQVKDKDTAEKYGVTEFPTVHLIPSPGDDPVVYDGEIKRIALVSFFTQVAAPNPDPAPQTPKSKNSKPSSKNKSKQKASTSASAAFAKASSEHEEADFQDHLAGSGTILEDLPTESPLPIVEEEKPMTVPEAAPPVPTLATREELETLCLQPKSGNCLLILLPAPSTSDEISPEVTSALTSLADLAAKFTKRKTNMIPMYAVTADNEAAGSLREELMLKPDGDLEVIALNVKRRWYRRYSDGAFDGPSLESFVDAIRLGDGTKSKLPSNFAVEAPEPTPVPAEAEDTAETEVTAESEPADETGSEAQETLLTEHDEL